MDSAVQLALMSKAKKVFGSGDTFLSFPVSLPTYTRRELDFFAKQDADALRQSLHNLQEFSTLVNLIPRDEAWLPTETSLLWDVYEQVLREGNFATSSRTPEEEVAYQAALAYLRTATENGIGEDSAAVKAYRQYKDAYLLAQQTYLAAKSTAECSTDPAVQQHWEDIDEPLYRQQLDTLQAQWIIEGHKNEVTAAQNTVVSLGARSPLQTWSEWNSHFNRDIDSLTDAADNFTAFPSFFSPSNALEEGAWKPFRLTEQEVTTLLNEAPAELRARLGTNSPTVASLTFEFSSATIMRPWFVSEAFRSRFWRFADANRFLSDGGTPRTGICPAYVTALVFARKVQLEEKETGSGKVNFDRFDGFRFEIAVKDQERLPQIRLEAVAAEQRRHWERANLSSQILLKPEYYAATTSPVAMNVQAKKVGMMQAAIVQDVGASSMLAHAVSMRPIRNFQQAVAFTRLPEALILPPITPPPQPQPPPPTSQSEAIYILAFICKALPKCPDPDLTLSW